MKEFSIKIIKNVSLAALLMASAMFTACSSSDEILNEQPVNPTEQQVYTMTVTATKGGDATTRGLSLSGKTLSAKWNKGEVVKVVQQNDDAPYDFKEIGTLTATASSNGETTLTGRLTVAPTHKRDIYFYLHDYNMVYTGQTGQLLKPASGTDNSIEAKYDYAMATAHCDVSGQFSVDEAKKTVSVPGGLTFSSQQAIVKFTLTDVVTGEAIKPTSLTINGTYTPGSTPFPNITQIRNRTTDPQTDEQGPLTLTLDGTTNEIYVAISQYMSLAQFSYDFTLTATDADGNTYSYTKDDVIFNNGKYYDVKVNMLAEADKARVVYLSQATADETGHLIVKDGQVLVGKLENNLQVSIDPGATVTLSNVDINGDGTWTDGYYAGITCEGDATINLVGTNNVRGFETGSSGIYVHQGRTLTIKGNGTLYATGSGGSETEIGGAGIGGYWNSYNFLNSGTIRIEGGTIYAQGGYAAAGIGGVSYLGHSSSCDGIIIKGGTVNAQGGRLGAGIGSGYGTSCGDITISGGTVNATGGSFAAGIGCGSSGHCGDITISGGTVTATKGNNSSYCIGSDFDHWPDNSGTITIGGTVYYQSPSFDNPGGFASTDLENALKAATFSYPAP